MQELGNEEEKATKAMANLASNSCTTRGFTSYASCGSAACQTQWDQLVDELRACVERL